MTASDYVAEFLARRGVRQVYELVGGAITSLIDSIGRHPDLSLVSMHHEQAAAFAAEGMARITGVPGIAMATSGPGATNLLTGIGSCYYDSTPAVFITGQVNRAEQKGSRPIRQLGFQETDIVSMAIPVTKAAWRVLEAAELPAVLTKAFTVALSGRPGPVVVDIPMDVQRADVGTPQNADEPAPHEERLDDGLISGLLDALLTAKRPLILAGGGIHSARALAQFRAVADRLRIPVVGSLMAIDVLPAGNPLRVGFIGSYGNRWANIALSQSDLLLVIGSRLDIRQTGADTASFKRGRKIFHVDCDVGEINNRLEGCVAIVAEIRSFLDRMLAETAATSPAPRSAWLLEIDELRRKYPDTNELKGIKGINPNALMHEVSKVSGRARAFVADVGQHQMWAAQSLDLAADQRFLTSGGMGAMGFALPAAIGASLGAGGPVVLIAGDGGFQLNLQELQTVHRNRLPLKMIVLNNGCHGMVRQFQQSYFAERYTSTLEGYSAPNFANVAGAYGIAAERVETTAQVREALDRLWKDPVEPYLLEVAIDTFANAYPKIAFGRPISAMEPDAVPIEWEGT